MKIKKSWLVAGIAMLSVVALGVGYMVMSKPGTSSLADDKIKNMYDCGRTTQDYRETDVFCRNYDFYRDTNVTEIQYRDYLECDKALQQPDVWSGRSTDVLFPNAYEQCSDKAKFDAGLVAFKAKITELKKAAVE